jgi:hypothetical protein
LTEQVFDFAMDQIEAIVEPDSVENDIGGKSMAMSAGVA